MTKYHAGKETGSSTLLVHGGGGLRQNQGRAHLDFLSHVALAGEIAIKSIECLLTHLSTRKALPGVVAKGWRLLLARTRHSFSLYLVQRQSSAYSVLTHEQIVDLLWSDAIQGLCGPTVVQ